MLSSVTHGSLPRYRKRTSTQTTSSFLLMQRWRETYFPTHNCTLIWAYMLILSNQRVAWFSRSLSWLDAALPWLQATLRWYGIYWVYAAPVASSRLQLLFTSLSRPYIVGKTETEVEAELKGVPDADRIRPHKVFEGNRVRAQPFTYRFQGVLQGDPSPGEPLLGWLLFGMFHHFAQLLSQFCQFSAQPEPGRGWNSENQSKPNRGTPGDRSPWPCIAPGNWGLEAWLVYVVNQS